MSYNLRVLLEDYKRLGGNTFWKYLLESLEKARMIQWGNIGTSTSATLDQIRVEQGKFNQMDPIVLVEFIKDLVFEINEAIKSGQSS